MNMNKEFAITLDTDWAPDFIIDHVAAILLEHKVPATWFVTNPAPAIDRLRSYPELFELGIHPNFNTGSSQGNSIPDVLRYCCAMLPEARSMRTHGLLQSTSLLSAVMELTSITVDVSVYLPDYPVVIPCPYEYNSRTILRIPFVWEDDFYFSQAASSWDIQQICWAGEGPRVLNFHPVHVFLNSRDNSQYTALKEAAGDIAGANPEQVAPFVAQGVGTGTLFRQLVTHASGDFRFMRIADIRDEWLRHREKVRL